MTLFTDLRTNIHAEALAARAAGDFDQAVAAWRTLLDRSPEDWRLALELKADLKAGLHYPDSDPRFRRAARFLPDEAWLEHYAALYAFHGSDLEAIDERARLLLARWPDQASLYAIRADVARQRRDWPGAVDAFETAHQLDPQHAEYAVKLAAAHHYRRLASQHWPDTGPGYAVFVVNLDRNNERMVELGRQFDAVPTQRIAAVEGSRLPGAAVRNLTGDERAPRGTLGCFLSHAAAWEAFLASGESHALIIEDDVIPLLELPQRLGGLQIPDGFELCFVNDRMEPNFNKDGAARMQAQDLAAAMRAFHPEDNAPGADGYLLSRAGARKLLDWTGHDGFTDHVDWRMLAYSLNMAEIETMPANSHARRELTRLQAVVSRPARLAAYALHPALIRTVGVSSDREDEDRLKAS